MKTLVFAIAIFLLLITTTFAVEETREIIFGSEELLIEVDLTSSFKMVAEESDYSLNYVNVNLTLFPKKSSSQEVKFTKLEPRPRVDDNSLLFSWTDAEIGEFSFSAVAKVTSRNDFVPIKNKVPFPITNLNAEFNKYVLDSETVDSYNQDIINLASSLASGEDDLFVVVYKLAEWSNRNIEYNLSTLTAEVSKPASWVLQNRQGVCDELTNLFIALSRSLGIPARFVSGISYTDSDLFPENWGFHGWAEVYFPGHGWVPFDVTYGEFGFVDPGHIKFMDSVDVTETTTNYQWRGRNVEIETMDLTPKITLKEASGKITPDVKLTSKALKSVVGFGSYNIEEVEITNLKDYYVVAELVHGRTEQLELIDNSKRDILLKPLEKKFEYFVFKVNESLRERFVYTFPLSMIAHLASTETEFKASSAAQKFTLEEVNALKIEQEPEKVYSRNVNLECTAEQEIYIYENVEVRCNAANAGNVALNNLYFCHGKCELFSLGITRDKDFTFVTNFTTLGNNRVKVLVDSDSVSKSAFVEVNVLDIPAVAFSEINYPKKISYNDVYKIEMLVEKASVSSPTGIELVISRTAATFNFDNLETSRQITAELRAIDLEEGLNELQISATFKDGNGRLYEETQTITIEVERLNFIQKIKKFFLRLF